MISQLFHDLKNLSPIAEVTIINLWWYVITLSQKNQAADSFILLQISQVRLMFEYVGDITGFLPDAITPIYCVAVKKGKSEILSVKYFYFLKKMFSIVQKETIPHGHNLHWVRI